MNTGVVNVSDPPDFSVGPLDKVVNVSDPPDFSVGPLDKVNNVSDPPDSSVGPFVKVNNVSDPPDSSVGPFVQVVNLIVGGEEVHMYYGTDSRAACIQGVCVARTAVVPPSSGKRVRCRVVGSPGLQSKDLSLFQPTHRLPFWIPWIVFDRGK